MSALGQKQTFAVQDGMSAVTPNSADMCGAHSACLLCAKSGLPMFPKKISLGGNCGAIDRWQNKLIQLRN